MAQISQNNGSSQQENRASPMGTSPDSPASAAHESHKPQAKDAAATHAARPLGRSTRPKAPAGSITAYMEPA